MSYNAGDSLELQMSFADVIVQRSKVCILPAKLNTKEKQSVRETTSHSDIRRNRQRTMMQATAQKGSKRGRPRELSCDVKTKEGCAEDDT